MKRHAIFLIPGTTNCLLTTLCSLMTGNKNIVNTNALLTTPINQSTDYPIQPYLIR